MRNPSIEKHKGMVREKPDLISIIFPDFDLAFQTNFEFLRDDCPTNNFGNKILYDRPKKLDGLSRDVDCFQGGCRAIQGLEQSTLESLVKVRKSIIEQYLIKRARVERWKISNPISDNIWALTSFSWKTFFTR